MHRRSFLVAACASLALSGCRSAQSVDGLARQTAASAQPTFVSERISVVARGRGPDIILLHGLAAHREVWAGIVDSLDERYRLHIVQMNGFGGVAPGPNASGPVAAPVADEIARYIRETLPQGAALIGHSMGGTIGMMVAARHPRLVRRLMVVDMPPFLGSAFASPGAPPDSIRAMADRIRQGILATPPGGTGMLEQMIPTMTRVDSARTVLLQYARASERTTVANALHEIMLADLRPELPRITAPLTALYVVPATVPVSPAEFDRVMQTMFGNVAGVRLVRIDNSNHYIHFDQPGRFVAEVDAFMRQ